MLMGPQSRMIAKPRAHRVFSRRPGSILRYVGISVVLIFLFLFIESPSERGPYSAAYFFPLSSSSPKSPPQQQRQEDDQVLPPPDGAADQQPIGAPIPPYKEPHKEEHPIAKLMRDAEDEFDRKLTRQSRTLEEAAAEYRKRRGRHPPPGFKVWYQFATDLDAVIVEDFWDQIYDDLAPWWAVPPAQIRKQAWDWEMTINVRNGTAYAKSDWFWTQIWLDMIQHIEQFLPDMDLALNAMDEPRVVAPWEEIVELMSQARKTAYLLDPKEAIGTYEVLPEPGDGEDRTSISQPKNWLTHGPYMDIVRRGCPPDSPARRSSIYRNFDRSSAPPISASNAQAHMDRGFVSNYTLSTSVCHQPDLQRLSGIFIDPLSVSSTAALFPMFGGSKLSVNNEILIPPAMYWGGGPYRFVVEEDELAEPSWQDKSDSAFWRGVASGGWARERNWRGFQRHRFLAISNGTKLTYAEHKIAPPENFALPDEATYGLRAQAAGKLGRWTSTWSNMSFTDLSCVPSEEDGRCAYMGKHFSVAPAVPLSEMYGHKILPDVDGNSYSGRYLSFLRSSSLPVKATLFREWHDSRLVAWKHFVPMDSRFGDWHALVEYFLGYRDPDTGVQVLVAHDEAAERIATAGREWAARALRKEDMLVYVLRLLLEYARVSDKKRERMGWVDDLLPEKK